MEFKRSKIDVWNSKEYNSLRSSHLNSKELILSLVKDVLILNYNGTCTWLWKSSKKNN